MIGTFTEGQRVNVYPHGYAYMATQGTVALISGNQKAIAVELKDGVTFFAFRYDIGPWIELFNNGHYEIDALN